MEKLAPIKTLEVIYSNIIGGGEIRTFNIIKQRKRTNIICRSLLLLKDRVLSDPIKYCPPLGYTRSRSIINHIPSQSKISAFTISPDILVLNFKLWKPVVDIVISHNDNLDYLKVTLRASSSADTKNLASMWKAFKIVFLIGILSFYNRHHPSFRVSLHILHRRPGVTITSI